MYSRHDRYVVNAVFVTTVVVVVAVVAAAFSVV
jgi:hypothetical protein